jgi:hypothetical protein
MAKRRRSSSRGLVGLALTLIGVAILGANVRYGSHVFISITPNHGLHETDLAGAALVAIGTALVWFRR